MSTFEIRTIPLASITTDVRYQREFKPERAQFIADHFDPAQWNLPKVVASVGKNACVVGQHRIGALHILLARGEWPLSTSAGHLQAQIVEGLDSEGEADLFLDDIANVKPVSQFAQHNAALEGKRSPRHQRAVDIQSALDRYGIPLRERQRSSKGRFAFMAIAALNNLWNVSGGDEEKGIGGQVVDETLRLVSKWKEDDGYRFEGSLVGGFGLVVRDLLKTEGHTGRLERVVERNTALAIATKAMIYAGVEQTQGRGRPSLSQPSTYQRVITALLPKARTAPVKPPFVSRFPVAVEVGAI